MSYTVVPICLSGNNIGVGEASKYLIPIELQYTLSDNLKVKNTPLIFNDGFRFYTNKFLQNLKDVSCTKNIAHYLTDLKTWDDFVYDGYNPTVSPLNNNTKILFDRLNNTGFFYAYIRDVTSPNPYGMLYINEDLNVSVSQTEKALVKITKAGNKVRIHFYETKITNYRSQNKTTKEFLLAVDVSSFNHTIALVSSEQDLTNYIYEFNLTLDQDLIRISYDISQFKNHTEFEKNKLQSEMLNQSSQITRYLGIQNDILQANHVYRSFTSEFTNTNKYKDTLNIFKTSFFALINPGYNQLTLGISEHKQNTWVGYYNEIFDKQNNQNVKPNPELTVSKVPINYLLTSTFKIQTSPNKINVNIIPLKTVYTPEQETIKNSTPFINGVAVVDAEDNLQPIQRTYTRVFSNNNQVENYSNIHLGFSSGTKELVFKTNHNSFFHYPLQADPLPISQANLIEAGALPGATPYLADKIFMKNADYGTKSVWGHLTPPPGCLDGQFLCAWLSGSDASSLSGLENSVWMDRWYDSATVTEVSALQLSTNKIRSNTDKPTIVDIPSQMILNPGGWYFYHHIGNDSISTFIDSLNIGTTGARLITQGDISTFRDVSNYDNIINIVSSTDNTIVVSNPDEQLPNNYVLSLDGNNYATIQHTDALDLTKNATIAMWVYSEDWNNNPGYHVIDNGFRGGWAVRLGNNFYNPTVAVGEATYGNVLNFSTQLQPYVDNVLLSGGEVDFDNVVVTNELFTFVFDKSRKSLAKFDYSGDMVDLIDLSTYTQQISNSKLMLGPSDILHLHFNDTLLKTDTSFTSTTSESLNYTNFTLDLNGKVIGGDFIDAAIDNQNNIWYISSCPVSFFTEYTQPDLNGPFFQLDSTQVDFQGRSIVEALTSNGDLNFVFHCKANNSSYLSLCSEPISVVDFNNNGITFATFFPNNAENGILSKFFQPTRIEIDQDNHLYITNNTQELTKFIIDKNNQLAGFIFRKPLITSEATTGLSLSGVNSYIQTNIIDRANDEHRDDPQFKYLEIKTSRTLWKDIAYKYNLNKINTFTLNREFNYDLNSWQQVIYYINNSSGILYKFDTDGNYLDSVQVRDAYDIQQGPLINKNLTNYTSIATTYDYFRKYILPTINLNDNKQLLLDVYTIKNNVVTKTVLSSKQAKLINKEWHHITFTYSYETGELLLYIDGVQTDSAAIDPESAIYYAYKNNIGIGVSVLKFNTLQDDLKTSSYLFRGRVDDIRIYDHVLTRGNIGRLILNKYKIHDMVWNVPSGSKNYIEEIKQFYKHKSPGSKSALFDLYLTNTGIQDPELKQEIENIIKDALPRVAPSYTRINKIIWN